LLFKEKAEKVILKKGKKSHRSNLAQVFEEWLPIASGLKSLGGLQGSGKRARLFARCNRHFFRYKKLVEGGGKKNNQG